ncbi:MAG: hypothetical protein CVU81_01065, partial [Euryarchaeota archaeon HGW-Euryarchaeota-1]
EKSEEQETKTIKNIKLKDKKDKKFEKQSKDEEEVQLGTKQKERKGRKTQIKSDDIDDIENNKEDKFEEEQIKEGLKTRRNVRKKQKSEPDNSNEPLLKIEEQIKKIDAFQEEDGDEDNVEDEKLPPEKKIPSKISLTSEKQEEIRQFFFKVFKETRYPQTDHKQKHVCSVCEGRIIKDSTTGEEFCEKCGNVIDISISTGQDWRAFDYDQLVSRTRAQASKSIHHADGIGSMVGKGSVDIKRVPSYKQKEYYRLRNWQMRIITTVERNLQMAYGELLRMQSYFNLPFFITEEIKLIYKQLITERVVRGRAREQILGALLFIVMRKHKTPLTFAEIAKYFGIDKKKITITYKLIFQTVGFSVTPVRTNEYFDRFAKLVSLNAKSRDRLNELYDLVKSKKMNGEKNAVVDAAALVLIVAYEQNRNISPIAFLSLKSDDITSLNLKKSASLFIKELKLDGGVLDIFK